MGVSSSILILAALLPGQAAPVFYADFRGGKPLPGSMRFSRQEDESLAKPEQEGLRITVPAGAMKTDAVGIRTAFPVKGNFDITAGYEILQMDRPTKGYGVGFEFFIQTSPSREAIGFSHMIRPNGKEVYAVSRNTTDKEGKRHYRQQYFDAKSRKGRLRMLRTGTEVTCSVAEGDADDFRELCRLDLGIEDLQFVRVAGYTSHTDSPVDLRLLDLRIRSDVALDAPPREVAIPSLVSEQPGGRGLSALIVILGVLALLFAAIGLLVYLRRRRGRGAALAAAPRSGTNEPAPSIAVACAGCGKKLHAPAHFAGKKVKCPQCGQAVLVALAAP